MWDRILTTSSFARYLYHVNYHVAGGKRHLVPFPKKHSDPGQLLKYIPSHLVFSPEEEMRGREELQKIGVPEGQLFICFHARDSAYLNATYPNFRWDYHDYRDSNIQNYLPAIESLTKKGYYAIRLGAIVKDSIDTNNPKIIDYASKYRTDFMDIYLIAHSQFLMTANSGPCAVAWLFRKPNAYVNMAPFLGVEVALDQDMFIPKKYWLASEHRFMTFREMLQSGAAQFGTKQQFDNLGIILIENSPDEIVDFAFEMYDRLNGLWKGTEEDMLLYEQFRIIMESYGPHGIRIPRIGSAFLRKYRELLR
jgi:putative glycosyltransferase (TIGR04372 family)